MDGTGDGPRATAREWAGLTLLALPCLLVSFDSQALNLAIPKLTVALHPSATELLWIVDSYVFFGAGSLITMGVLGARVGRRRMLFIGGAVFALAFLGGLLAPVIAGSLVERFWWGSVFLVAGPIVALLLVLGPFLLPRSQALSAGRLDIVSAVTSLAAVLSGVYGLKRIAQTGLDPLSIAAIVLGGLLAVLFVRRQSRRDDPMVDLGLFRRTAFSVALASNTLSFFVLYGSQLWIAQYLQVVLGLSPLRAGIYIRPSWATSSARRSPRRPPSACPAPRHRRGLVIVCVGFAVLTGVTGGHGLALVIAGSVVFSVGLAPVYALTTEIIVASVPPERAGSASAIAETGSELGGALGIAVLGSLGVAIYRHLMSHADLPPKAAAESGGTIGSASALARTLPAAAAHSLMTAAAHAFTEAFAVMSGVSAAIIAIIAVVAFRLVRNREG